MGRKAEALRALSTTAGAGLERAPTYRYQPRNEIAAVGSDVRSNRTGTLRSGAGLFRDRRRPRGKSRWTCCATAPVKTCMKA